MSWLSFLQSEDLEEEFTKIDLNNSLDKSPNQGAPNEEDSLHR